MNNDNNEVKKLTKEEFRRLQSKKAGSLSLEELKALARYRGISNMPLMLPDEEVDFSDLRGFILNELDTIREIGRPTKDYQQFLFEEVIDCLYGENSDEFWSWWNNNSNE